MATDQELVSTWSDPTERGDEGSLCLGSDSQSSPDQDESEKKTKKPDDEEDGEVSSDEESEEGEIKDGGQDEFMPAPLKHPNKIPGNTGNTQNNQQQKTSICKFFAKGQCTWGMNCRFLHLAPQPVPLPLKVPNQRGHQFQAGLHPTGLHPPGVHPTGLHPAGPTGAHMTGHHQNRAPDYNFMAPPVNRHPPGHLGPPIPPPHHQPPPPPPAPQGTSSNNPESAWERGLRHAKEMIKKASRRKEEEVDFDDKRFNLGVEDETSHSRNSHRSRESPEAPEYDGARVRGGSRSPPLHYKEWSDYKEPMHYRDYHREKDKSAHPREAQDPAQRPSDREREREREREFRERERERERERARRYNSRDDHYNSEYERRRRLAFESAPWNDEQSSLPSQAKPTAGRSAQRPREAAEVYRDPWRRSKSPPSKWPAPNARRVEGSSTSKRSHSMSSISESQSGSDLSDSDSLSGSESFSGSESYTDRSDGSGHSPKQTDRKSNQPHRERLASSGHVRSDSRPISRSGKDHGDPTMKGAPIRDRAQPSNKNRAARGSIDDEATGIDNLKRKGTDKSIPATSSRPRRDSWSDSDSGSSKTGSSASGSDSEDSDASIPASDKSAQAQRRASNPMARSKEQPRQPIRSPPLSSDNRKNIRARSNYSPSKERGPAKRMKMSSSNTYPPSREGISKSKHSHERGSSDDQKMGSPPSSDETPKKKLIKMTFKKKHSNLKQDRTLTAQLNGDESDGGGEPHARNSRSPSPCIASKESNLTCSKEVDSIKTSSPPSSQPMKETSLLDDLRKSVKKSPPKNDLNPVASKPRSRDDPTTSRRDDLLKQLELVEAMIQKKKALSKPEIDDDWDVPESYRTP